MDIVSIALGDPGALPVDWDNLCHALAGLAVAAAAVGIPFAICSDWLPSAPSGSPG